MKETKAGAIWRRLVGNRWLRENQSALDLATGGHCAFVERPHHARISAEYFCANPAAAKKLQARFGGTVESVPADWLERCARSQMHSPIRVGRRLLVVAEPSPPARKVRTPELIIPAGAAFGTGDHATTAMSLRFLEEISRGLRGPWSLFDAGTGSGILALAAHRFGATDVLGIDHDPRAIKTARANAALNGIVGPKFRVADVLRPQSGRADDIITANLFSDLLIETAPLWQQQLRPGGRLIVSGILCAQAAEVKAALTRHGFELRKIRRRGKWIALLAGRDRERRVARDSRPKSY